MRPQGRGWDCVENQTGNASEVTETYRMGGSAHGGQQRQQRGRGFTPDSEGQEVVRVDKDLILGQWYFATFFLFMLPSTSVKWTCGSSRSRR